MNAPQDPRTGNFLGDIADWVINTSQSVIDTVLPVLRSLPGGKEVESAINQGADWVGDIVQLPGADIVLKSLAMLTYGPVAQSLGGISWFGPQIASAVWALPGVVRGQNFVDAWAFEVKDRTEKTAQIIGGDAAKEAMGHLPEGFQYLNQQAKEHYPNLPLDEGLRLLSVTPEQLAKALNIRPDVAAELLKYAKNNMELYDMNRFNLRTGRRPEGDTNLNLIAQISHLTEPKPLKRLGKFSSWKLAASKGGLVFMPESRLRKLSFNSSSDTGTRGPLGQILVLLVLTSPAWGAYLGPKIISHFRGR